MPFDGKSTLFIKPVNGGHKIVTVGTNLNRFKTKWAWIFFIG